MGLDRTQATMIAMQYFNMNSPPKMLGDGVSAYVFQSLDEKLAAKVHSCEEHYRHELKIYHRLTHLRIADVLGFRIPSFREFNHKLKIICMSKVDPPFLVDFVSVTFTPPDFSLEIMTEMWRKVDEDFAPNGNLVRDVYHFLAERGLYYLDFTPKNLDLTGHKLTKIF